MKLVELEVANQWEELAVVRYSNTHQQRDYSDLNQSSVSISKGSTTTLSCTYTGSAYSLHWYQQKPGSRPEFIMLIMESTQGVTKAQQPDPRFSIKLHKQDKKVDLEISSTAVSDSALYYCALQPTVTGSPSNTVLKPFL
uniref:Ig-like domain-containing protein n=1 Tax=Astyanax mexicanus TaxID=7994 RepID=A0A8B9RM50_ASTMX